MDGRPVVAMADCVVLDGALCGGLLRFWTLMAGGGDEWSAQLDVGSRQDYGDGGGAGGQEAVRGEVRDEVGE